MTGTGARTIICTDGAWSKKNTRGGSGQYEGRDAVDDCTFTAVSAVSFASSAAV